MARTLTRRARGPPGRYRGRAIKSPPYSCRSWPSKGSELKPCDGVAVAKLHAAAARSTGTLRKLKLLRRDAGALQKRELWQRCGAIRCHSSRFRNRNALLAATAHIYATPVLLPLPRHAFATGTPRLLPQCAIMQSTSPSFAVAELHSATQAHSRSPHGHRTPREERLWATDPRNGPPRWCQRTETARRYERS